MSNFAADLHIHSRFSRATSKGLTVRNLAAWAEVKGLTVLGTGDCTHPGWLQEVERELKEDGSGLLSLRDPSSLAGQIPGLPMHLAGSARFMLQGEISSIYKRGGKVRKVHNLVYLPSLESAKRLNARLAQVGNLVSDGRPILGLDSRNLLEMVLETHPQAFLVPAHIWTPWFSLFGSMSGFDSVEECYGDLASHIFAMETGLSSDPGMNWTLSALDRFRMISNSDAHSGEKLGREANLFSGEASFGGIRGALRAHLTKENGGCEFMGTVEFFPEEGKYHLDGHRKCNWSMEPGETLAHKGLCPVCGRPATLGVLHRVLALADRPEPAQPQNQPGYHSLIPLREVLSEVLDVGAGSKAVTAEYYRLLERLGPELFILREAPLADIGRAAPVLAEAVERMHAGKVLRSSGYDGEFGVITVFTPEERAQMRQGRILAGLPARRVRRAAVATPSEPETESEGDPVPAADALPPRTGLNPAQEAAVAAGMGPQPGPVLVLAGPGTGKTHTLLARVLRLLESGATPESLAIVTFTRRAADELHERLAAHFGPNALLPLADTLHALALDLWTARKGQPPVLLSEDAARRMFLDALGDVGAEDLPKSERLALFRRHSLARETLTPLSGPDAALAAKAAALVAETKALRNQADFTDLLEYLLDVVRDPEFNAPFAHLLVDEVQDLSALQLEAVLGLAGPVAAAPESFDEDCGDTGVSSSLKPCTGTGFFAIGDPEQSIYSFRGATGDVRKRLAARWPVLQVVSLAENYRSGQGILDAAGALLPAHPRLDALPGREWDLELVEAPDARHEASLIAARIGRLIGGASLTLMDAVAGPSLAPGDVAVLVRFRALIPPLKAALELAGLPCSAPEAEVFWEEPRVAAILRVAERLFGLPAPEGAGSAGLDASEAPIHADLPEFLLLQGPRVLPAALRDTSPFDRFFWDGPAFRDLCHAFDEHGGWVGLLDWVRLETDFASIRQAAQKVRILTLHAAKGLEFEAVFLPALEQGIMPLSGFGGEALTPAALAEERRLLYVGMTRAKSRLCLSFAHSRTLYGKTLAQKASDFLADLPTHLLRRTVLAQKVQTRQTHLSLFQVP
ncbi:MAG: UvrD-helicase domain-containing protein [Humidesulfovibrio sp.]|uniref:UvrD-helicase domain-containing protein n=1 Tax=Humidesulfovibrio sp. TaxID=2910988 RepID=UPI0027329F67|nr:UvrD-helicase domain-containing protein [Humidesulfovibrio sp.]MDP2847881.1 UvrD-helicase domain-containing protein [Humidesulfovibrio sp.]